jgi:integrase
MSGGKRSAAKITLSEKLTLKKLFDLYDAALPDGAKEKNTVGTERVHKKHFLRTLGAECRLPLSLEQLQNHVNKRLKEPGRRGNSVGTGTIKKELGTLHVIWEWGKRSGLLKGELPTVGLLFPKTHDKPPFQTRKQIEQKIARGGLSKAEIGELWGSLYLELPEIAEILGHVKMNAREPWVFPMMVFVARTGSRRSEALRSQMDDFDFENKVVRIREKKKTRGKVTYRHVPMSPCLIQAMKTWQQIRPGGQYTFCAEANRPLDENMTNHHFGWALQASTWEGKLTGWHVFRHSFASLCARRRVDQRMIDKWMGHQTEAMRKRYQHLFPDDQHEQLSLVFGSMQ